jgi:hypothetical protein
MTIARRKRVGSADVNHPMAGTVRTLVPSARDNFEKLKSGVSWRHSGWSREQHSPRAQW